MPGIEIKGRSKIANYRHGGRTGKFGGGRTNLLEELGRVEGERSNPNRRAEISRVHGELNRGYAKGGRAGFVHGEKVVRQKKFEKEKVTVDPGKRKRFIGSPTHRAKSGARGSMKEKKYTPYITEEGKKMVPSFNTSGQFLRYNEKKQTTTKKMKDYVIDPDETVGGRRIQTKGGPELIPPKRKDDVGVGGYQVPEKDLPSRRTKDKRSPTHPDDLRPEQAKGGRIGFKKGTDKRWIQKAVDPKHKGYCTPMTKKTCTPARKALARTFKKKAKTGWG